MVEQDCALEPGARLVHIGPHKTGTTTIQGAFALARERLPEHGVVYPGASRQPMHAVLAVAGKPAALPGARAPEIADWTRLVGQVDEAGDKRVAVSSEFFADAGADAIPRIIEDLGGARVHVVVTLRPLTKIVVSQWQQYVQNGTRTAYEEWLDKMLNQPPYDKPTPTFWHRHRHDKLIDRWADAVGYENMTVVVADEADPMHLVRSFEALLDLPDGILQPEQERTNRSLTLGEIELVREFNREFKRLDWPEPVYMRYVRQGAFLRMKTEHQPLPTEAKMVTPKWAADRIAEIGNDAADRIGKTGVRVLGDLEKLKVTATVDESVRNEQSPELSISSAAQAILGAIAASGAIDPNLIRLEDRRVVDVTTRDLVGHLMHRVSRRVRGKR